MTENVLAGISQFQQWDGDYIVVIPLSKGEQHLDEFPHEQYTQWNFSHLK